MMINEDGEYVMPIIPARIDDATPMVNEFKEMDPFNKTWDDIKSVNGMDQNFKRRAARMSKAVGDPEYLDSANATPTGVDAKSKALNPGIIFRNSYSLFDVITPPYNL